MNKQIVLLNALVLSLFLFSCGEDSEDCSSEFLQIPVEQLQGNTTSNTFKQAINTISSPLTEDVYVDGDVVVDAILDTNGYNVYINGNLTVNANLIISDASQVEVVQQVTVSGSLALNSGTIICDGILISGNVHGPGYVYYCSQHVVSGTITENQTEDIFVEDCGIHLSTNTITYSTVIAPCSYEGKTIDGYRYILND